MALPARNEAVYLPNLLNFTLFQLAWFACLLAPLATVISLTITVLLFHFLLMGSRREVPLVLLCLVTGFLFDTALQAFGFMRFRGDSLFQPPWLTCLWLLFAITISHSLAFFFRYGKAFCFASGFSVPPSATLPASNFKRPVSPITKHSPCYGSVSAGGC